MVGTAQAADFAIFMRKIGYSVGLENLLARVSDFGRAYGATDSLRYADWMKLVREQWKLRSDHVGDVFASLRIVRIVNREPIPGPIGEALGILSRRLTDDEYRGAVRFLTLVSIIGQDGDIFLNALAASFDRAAFAESLVGVIRSKRELLYGIFQHYPEQEAVYNAVAIDRQRTNRGSAGGTSLDALAKGKPLGVRSAGLGLPQRTDLMHIEEPSADYIDKVLVTRRGWAEALDLFGPGGLSPDGLGLLSSLRKQGFGQGAGSFLVWPTKFEVSKARFDVATFDALSLKSTLEVFAIVRSGLHASHQQLPDLLASPDGLADYIAGVYSDFRSLSQNRSMIRNELPLEVLGGTMYAEAFAKEAALDISALDLEEPHLAEHGIAVRPSQSIELAITVRRREGIAAH